MLCNIQSNKSNYDYDKDDMEKYGESSNKTCSFKTGTLWSISHAQEKVLTCTQTHM